METGAGAAGRSKKMLWAGWILTALPGLLLLFSGTMKLINPAGMPEEFARLGYPVSAALGIGVVEILCTMVYLIPRTSAFGAILLTGYLGGAVATHVRIGDVFVMPLVVGILVWLGLYLRDARLRELVPLRKSV